MDNYRNFRSLDAWKAFATNNGLRVRKVSTSKSAGEYWQAISKEHGIVGFFQTKPAFGHIDLDCI